MDFRSLNKMSEPVADIAVIGLAVMGQNLILNMNDNGFTVRVQISFLHRKEKEARCGNDLWILDNKLSWLELLSSTMKDSIFKKYIIFHFCSGVRLQPHRVEGGWIPGEWGEGNQHCRSAFHRWDVLVSFSFVPLIENLANRFTLTYYFLNFIFLVGKKFKSDWWAFQKAKEAPSHNDVGEGGWGRGRDDRADRAAPRGGRHRHRRRKLWVSWFQCRHFLIMIQKYILKMNYFRFSVVPRNSPRRAFTSLAAVFLEERKVGL